MSKQNREQSRTARAAAIRVQQARKERLRKVALVVGIIVALGAIIAGGVWYGGGGSSPAAETRVPARFGTNSLVIGKPTAPLKVVVYEDFQCPFCREFEETTRDFLHEDAAKDRVQVEYRPLNWLQQTAYSARGLAAFTAVVAHSTPQVALKLHDQLFREQPNETQSDSVSVSTIQGWVKQFGGDSATVTAAAKPDQAVFASTHKRFLDASAAAGISQQLTGTPMVFVNGKPLSGSSMQQIADQLETLIAQEK